MLWAFHKLIWYPGTKHFCGGFKNITQIPLQDYFGCFVLVWHEKSAEYGAS
jgi:kynurenine formamidase